MINTIWCLILIISLASSLISGKESEEVKAIYSGIESALKLSFTMLGVMSFWSGISRMCERNGISSGLSKLLSPLIKRLFPKYGNDKATADLISMNFISNLLGLGNAATPIGIKAVNRMGEREKGINHEMILFVVINTCSLQLIPTSISALRISYGSKEPLSVLPAIWIVSAATLFFSVFLCKLLSGRDKK